MPTAESRAEKLRPLRTPLRPLHGPSLDAAEREEEKLQQVAHDFEALLVKQIFSSMRNSIKQDERSFGESTFNGMLDDQLSQSIADGGGLGLSDALMQELRLRSQGMQQPVDVPTQRRHSDED
ncbi:MAG: hypothetical protein EOO40_03470 [Deltaproteobacteria bacterium]|nr:MAG: hypothetical protein EOO40_03470 [Deltaproteobacteria bacterium]